MRENVGAAGITGSITRSGLAFKDSQVPIAVIAAIKATSAVIKRLRPRQSIFSRRDKFLRCK